MSSLKVMWKEEIYSWNVEEVVGQVLYKRLCHCEYSGWVGWLYLCNLHSTPLLALDILLFLLNILLEITFTTPFYVHHILKDLS